MASVNYENFLGIFLIKIGFLNIAVPKISLNCSFYINEALRPTLHLLKASAHSLILLSLIFELLRSK